MSTDLDEPVTRAEFNEIAALQVTLVMQIDELDRTIRHLRLWLLVLALLLLAVSIIVVELWRTVG